MKKVEVPAVVVEVRCKRWKGEELNKHLRKGGERCEEETMVRMLRAFYPMESGKLEEAYESFQNGLYNCIVEKETLEALEEAGQKMDPPKSKTAKRKRPELEVSFLEFGKNNKLSLRRRRARAQSERKRKDPKYPR